MIECEAFSVSSAYKYLTLVRSFFYSGRKVTFVHHLARWERNFPTLRLSDFCCPEALFHEELVALGADKQIAPVIDRAMKFDVMFKRNESQLRHAENKK